MSFAIEELTPVYLQIAEAVMARLPSAIVERLVWSRKAFRHGSKTDMILFNAWDKFQTGLERNQFNYCLNYKPLRPEDGGKIWLLQTRCNIKRIRKMSSGMRDAMRLELRRFKSACPAPFVPREDTQTVELRYTFNFERPLRQLPEIVVPLFSKLIETSHPVLIRAIDIFHGELPTTARSDSVGSLVEKRRIVRKDLGDFSATPTTRMKPVIVARYDGLCAYCGKSVKEGDLEFHHLVFKRDGGKRRVENFAPLHVLCHDEVHRLAGKDGQPPPGTLRSPSRE